MHPFNIENSSIMTSAKIEILLYNIQQQAENLKKDRNVLSKKDHLAKFKKQIKGMASLIDTWWIWVDECLQDADIDQDFKLWVRQSLLPFLYWQKQAARTKSPDLKEAYQHAADQAQAELDHHPLTQVYMEKQEILSWAKWMVANFQGTSSAVEGRNGWLSQMNHNERGISPKRLKAQTVLHNYYLKRDDGTTAAQRLFHHKFPDPLEWVVERMGDLPLPRKRKSNITCEAIS